MTSGNAGRMVALLGLLLAACGHGRAGAAQAAEGASPAHNEPVAPSPAPEVATAVVSPAVFVPSVPSAEHYGGAGLPAIDRDPLARQIRIVLNKRARDAGFVPPASDGRMDRAALELAGWHGTLAHELVNFICHHVGLAEPQPGVTALRTNHSDDDIVKDVLQYTQEALRHGPWARLGIGVVRGKDDVSVVVLLGGVAVTLEPVSRQLPALGSAALKGKIPAGYREPQVVVTTPGGHIGRMPVAANASDFAAAFKCVEGQGRYDVEVLASGPRGPEVMVNVPVYCGTSVPTRYEVPAADAFGDTSTPQGVESAMVAAINRERRKRKLPALEVDARLVRLARDHAADMANNREISHLSSRGEDAQVRVLAAGLRPRLVAENVGTATTASAVHEGFMGSPGHRSNVLETRASHVGVGAVQGMAPNGMPVWYVAELFAGFGAPPAPGRSNHR